jgi:hypothetical protein
VQAQARFEQHARRIRRQAGGLLHLVQRAALGPPFASAASTPRSRRAAVAWNASGAKASHWAALTASMAVKGSLS